MKKYLRVWWKMSSMSLMAQVSHPLGSLGFFLGKIVRVAFFFAFIIAIFRHVKSLAGYSLEETALFFLTFNIVDISAQILFRGIYNARRAVTEGDFDFYLIQPCPALFRLSLTTFDFLDALTLLPVLGVTLGILHHLSASIFSLRLLLYLLLTLNAVAIASSFHIFVAGLAVRTQELENTIWIYRDIMFMGRFPIEVYGPMFQLVLTFVVPIAVMTTFPVRAFLGLLSWEWIAYSFFLSITLLGFSFWFWENSVRQYTSSSS